jgi:hypothetical protein
MVSRRWNSPEGSNSWNSHEKPRFFVIAISLFLSNNDQAINLNHIDHEREMGIMLEVTRRKEYGKRIIRVSNKRQITIPLKFFKALKLNDQVECSMENGALVIRPLSMAVNEYSVEILKELVGQGYCGDELIQRFAEQDQKLKAAVRNLQEEADDIASGERHSASMSDIFGESSHV